MRSDSSADIAAEHLRSQAYMTSGVKLEAGVTHLLSLCRAASAAAAAARCSAVCAALHHNHAYHIDAVFTQPRQQAAMIMCNCMVADLLCGGVVSANARPACMYNWGWCVLCT